MVPTSISHNKVIIILGVILVVALSSCEKEYYVQTLNLGNKTGQNLTVNLYVKSPYLVHEGMYNIEIDDTASITGKPTVFTLDSNNVSIVYTYDTESSPVELVNKVFDSIIAYGEGTQYPIILKSSSSPTVALNPFETNSAWDVEAIDYPAECTMFCPNAHYYQTMYIFEFYPPLQK